MNKKIIESSVVALWGAIAFLGLFAGPTSALAQSQAYWDATSPIKASPGAGGAGTWNAANVNWWVSGSSDSTWASGNYANFAGTAGTVTLGAAETADGLTFTTAGYTISGSSTLTLAGTQIINVPTGTRTTISCVLAGTSYNKQGLGTVYLDNTGISIGNAGGTLTVSAGTLETPSSAYGYGYGTGTINMSGGSTLQDDDTTQGNPFAASYSVTVGSGGGVFYTPTSSQILLIHTVNGTGSLTKTGPGEIRCINTTASTYSGGLIVSGGVFTAGQTSTAGVNSMFGVPGSFSATAIQIQNGAEIRLNASTSISLTANQGITLSSGGSIGTVTSGVVFTIPTAITGSGPLTINGSINGITDLGQVTLSGINTYTGGGTTIHGGTLTIAGAGQLNSGAYADVITNNGTFTYNSSAAQTLSGVISGTGKLTQSAGTLTLSNTSTFTGGVTLNGGTLNINEAAALGAATGLFTIAGGTIDNTSGAAITTSAYPQAWNGNFAFTGTQNLNLGTGAVTPNASRQITINGGSLTVGGAIGGGAISLTKAGAGALTLNGTNTYTGNTTISSGTLALGAAGSINNSPVISIAGGATFDVSSQASFSLGTSTLSASGTTSNAATLNGGTTVDLGSQAISLSFKPTTFAGDASHPALVVSQGALNLSGNTISVNNAGGTPLGAGSYALIQVTGGTITGAPSASVSVTGSGIAAGATASISVSGGVVSLVVIETPVFTVTSTSITYGTASVTLGGKLKTTGGAYPANGETITVTMNGISQTTMINDSTGDFSLSSNSAAIPYNATPYPITYSYAGDTYLNSASDSSTALTVNKAALTVTASPQTKTYGQTVVFGSGSVLFTSSPLSNSETIGSVTLACSGGVSNAPVSGSPYPITPSAATGGSGTEANYFITYVTNGLTINPLTVVLAGTQPYDGTTNVTNSSLSVTNALGGDDVSVASGSGTMANSTIGTNAITSTGTLALGGITGPSYTLVGASGSVIVTPLGVNLTGSRPYDGTNDVSLSILTISNDVDGTNLVLSGSAILAGVNVGVQSISDYTGLSLSGSAATNYALANATSSVTITGVPLSITANPVTKTYGTPITLDPTAFVVGGGPLVGSEMVTAATMIATPGGTAANDPVGIDTITPSAATGTGGFLAGNYNIAYITNSLTVNPLAVVLSGSRPYDGTATATNTILTVANAVGLDDVNVSSGTGSATLASSNVGSDSITSVGSLALSGTTATNYTLTGVSGTVTIGAVPLSVMANPQSTAYGTLITLVGSTAFTPSGLQPGDTIGSVTLAVSGGYNSNTPIGTYTITPSAATGGTFNPANYNAITYVTNALTITPLPVVLTGTQVYNGTNIVTNSILSVANAVGSDDVNVASGGTTMASADVGTNALTLPGTLALGGTTSSNYTLSGASGSVIVTPLAVVLTGTRPYDGTATAAAAILSVSNAVAGDDVSAASGSATLAGSAAGAEAITDASGLVLGGTTATNYTLTGASGSVTITTVALSITANPVTKTYGTAIILDPTAFVVGGGPLVGSEMVTAVTMIATPGGTAATDPVGIDTITPSAATGTGGFLAANYNITYNTNSLTVNPLAVVLTGTRPYDGTATAAFGILTVSNVVGSDDVAPASGSVNLAGASVGSQAIASVGLLALGGTTATNYTLMGATGTVIISNPFNPFSIISSSLDNTGTNLVVCWQSVPGVVYSVLTNTSLAPPQSWAAAGGSITATNTTTCFTLPGGIVGGTNAFVVIKQ